MDFRRPEYISSTSLGTVEEFWRFHMAAALAVWIWVSLYILTAILLCFYAYTNHEFCGTAFENSYAFTSMVS